jgi:hypothetical protein
MSLFKVLETPAFVLPSMIIVLVVVLWSVIRVMKGASVVLDVSAARTFLLMIVAFALVFAGIVLAYDARYAVRAAVEHIPVAASVAAP